MGKGENRGSPGSGGPGMPGPRAAGRGDVSRRLTPEERYQMVQAYLKSGLTKAQFAQLWGVSDGTVKRWVNAFRDHGVAGLENAKDPRKGKLKTPEAVQAEVVSIRETFPEFGLRKIRDFLYRFRHIRVSTGTVRNVLVAHEVPTKARPRRKKRKRPQVRRFERAKPGELWQSDITSYVLPRHGQRVYLTVFLDDYSRYIVSWALALHQKSELVMECLQAGLYRYGKPVEILTDQGRQYFSWRGKSVFQKRLLQQGIKHVVARSHHPQTVGKCERLWGTIQEELWSRSEPQDLDDARERLGHWVGHYNFRRPHQGIDGAVPADRFFDAADAVRAELESQIGDRPLDAALSGEPRRGVYLVGEIGGEHVSLHGERGKLVVHTSEGSREISAESLGMPQEETDGRETEAKQGASSAPVEFQGGQDAGGCESALGVGECGGAGGGTSDGSSAHGALDGTCESSGDRRATGGGATAGMAAFADGAGRPGSGSTEAAEKAWRGPATGRQSPHSEVADREAGEAALTNGESGGHPARAASAPRPSRGEDVCDEDEYHARSEGQSEDGWPEQNRPSGERWHKDWE